MSSESTENNVELLIQQFNELLPVVKKCAEKLTEIRQKVKHISAIEFVEMCEKNDALFLITKKVNEQLEILIENE